MRMRSKRSRPAQRRLRHLTPTTRDSCSRRPCTCRSPPLLQTPTPFNPQMLNLRDESILGTMEYLLRSIRPDGEIDREMLIYSALFQRTCLSHLTAGGVFHRGRPSSSPIGGGGGGGSTLMCVCRCRGANCFARIIIMPLLLPARASACAFNDIRRVCVQRRAQVAQPVITTLMFLTLHSAARTPPSSSVNSGDPYIRLTLDYSSCRRRYIQSTNRSC